MQGSTSTSVAQSSTSVEAAWFGVIQTGYGTQNSFAEQLERLSGGSVRWPGGTLAETREDVYDIDLPELFDGQNLFSYKPGRQRPGLSDQFEFANSRDQGLSIVVPTARYAEDVAAGAEAFTGFLSRVLRGEFGEMPGRLTLEIGNEYYGQEAFSAAPERYGQVASAMIEAAARSLEDATPELRDKISIAVQMGKTAGDDSAIRSQMSQLALRTIDSVVFHALPVSLENFHAGSRSNAAADRGLSRVERTRLYAETWQRDVDVADGAPDLDLLASAWSIGASAMTAAGLEDLARQDYGARAAGTALEIFAAFSYLEVTSASIWGVDVPNLSRLSDDVGEAIAITPLGVAFAMMADSLPGTQLVAPYRPQDRSDRIMSYLYGDDARLVLFVAANDVEPGETYSSDLQAYGASSIISARALGWRDGDGSLTGTPLDRLDEVPVLLPAAAKLDDGRLSVTLRQDYEVVQVIIQRQIETGSVDDAAGSGSTDAVLPAGVEVGVGPGPETVALGGGDDLIRWQDLTPYPGGVYAQNVGSPAEAGTGQVVDVAGKLRMRAIIDGGDGRDRLMLTQGDDALFLHDDVSLFPAEVPGGVARIASIEVVKAGAGNDLIDLTSPRYSLSGTSLSLFGQAGDDILWGSDAAERIDGGEGDDVIFGGIGRDRLSGGPGADTFQFLPTSADQTILDFDPNEGDVIHLFSGQSRTFTGRADLRDDQLAFELLGRDGSPEYLSVRVRDADLITEDLNALYLIVG